MRKEYYLTINEDIINYLERLHYEVMTRHNVINTLFDLHKDDTDSSVLSSPVFKTYHKELEESEILYDKAKNEFSNYLIPLIQKNEQNENVLFNWNVEDFSERKVKITILENNSKDVNCTCCK